MSKNSRRISLFDTTLRDGQQTRGVDFTLKDKHAIATKLDALGLDYIEGGWPGANTTDEQFFATPPKLHKSRFVSFGMTRRPGRSSANDPVLAGLRDAQCDASCIVGKTWDFHVTHALGTTLDENRAMIRESLHSLGQDNREMLFDAEHFFDGYKHNPDYALHCLEEALKGGANWVVLCDTNGGCLPEEIYEITLKAATVVPCEKLGIHTHNDTGNAVANTLAALEAGARQIQGTLNGLGERCGNANLITLIPTLKLKSDYNIGISDEGLAQLTEVSRWLDEILGRTPNPHAPYVGESAFAHKAGLHASGVAKAPECYEHITPNLVGNKRLIVMSDQSGRANVQLMLEQAGLNYQIDADTARKIIERIKEMEQTGLTFDGADASFELFLLEFLNKRPEYFQLDRFRVIDERRWNARNEIIVESVALIDLEIKGRKFTEAATGTGPVSALDKALRKTLSSYSELEDMRLTDYKVRILDSKNGTDAVTRVIIENQDSQNRIWRTVGVSSNIIDASFMALNDAISWKLYHENVTPHL